MALAVAGLEYILHYQGDAERKRQAVVDILVRTIGSPIFGPAYHELYDDDQEKVLRMDFADFDKKVAQLSDIFSAVGVCAAAGLCEPSVSRKVFCYEFKTYEFAYNVTHPPGKRWQGFDGDDLAVFCQCDDTHRFSALKDKYSPAPWPGCGRNAPKGAS